jgi:hypothetical protein
MDILCSACSLDLSGTGAQLIANGTNNTLAGTHGGSDVQTALAPGSTSQMDSTKKTGEASRVGSVKVLVAFAVGAMWASMMGRLLH